MSNTDSVQRYWDHNASDFDALYDSQSRFSRAFNAVFRRALFDRIRLAADEVRKSGSGTVLDVGTGSGRTALPIARAGAKHVTGVDFSPQMIELATRAAREAGLSEQCTFKVGDFMTADVEGPFDVVTALGVFDYVDAPKPFLKRMLQLSRKAAMFSVPKPSLVRAQLRKIRYGRHGVNVHFYTADEVRSLCRDAGAKTITIQEIPAGYFAVCEPQLS